MSVRSAPQDSIYIILSRSAFQQCLRLPTVRTLKMPSLVHSVPRVSLLTGVTDSAFLLLWPRIVWLIAICLVSDVRDHLEWIPMDIEPLSLI